MPQEQDTHRSFRLLNLATYACGVGALGLLATIVSWPLEPGPRHGVHLATLGLVTVFLLIEALRLALRRHPWQHVRRHKLEIALAAVIATELLLGDWLLGRLGALGPGLSSGPLLLGYLAAMQLTLVGVIGLRLLRRNRFLSGRRLTPGMVLMLSFGALILLGTLLLKSPLATHEEIAWIDAAFTATSAVCVTGLVTLDTANDFTRHGQTVILVLFQLGGLGLMSLTYFFAFFFAGGVSIRNRIALQDLLSEENLAQVGTVLAVIVGFTLAVELGGALALYWLIGGAAAEIENPAFFALFHAVSAFCNAGFSTLSDGLADPLVDGLIGPLSVVMILIVVGGLGFPVWKNLWLVAVDRIGRGLDRRPGPPVRLTTNSRVVIGSTLLLLVGGAACIYVTEFVLGDGPSSGPRWFTALFHSVTARTAGFNITPTELLTPATAALVMFLMFVGGSPSSTAGGVKTSTVAVAFLSLRRVVLGRHEIEVSGRRLGDEIAHRALAVLLAAVVFITGVTVALCALHPELPPADLAFEAVSAVGTVGLSRGVTAELGTPAKVVVMTAMFVGRVGVLACLLALIPRRPSSGLRPPEGHVVIT